MGADFLIDPTQRLLPNIPTSHRAVTRHSGTDHFQYKHDKPACPPWRAWALQRGPGGTWQRQLCLLLTQVDAEDTSLWRLAGSGSGTLSPSCPQSSYLSHRHGILARCRGMAQLKHNHTPLVMALQTVPRNPYSFDPPYSICRQWSSGPVLQKCMYNTHPPTYTYMHTCTQMHTYMHAHTDPHKHTRICPHIHRGTHKFTCMRKHTHPHVCAHQSRHTHVQMYPTAHMHTETQVLWHIKHTCAHTQIHTPICNECVHRCMPTHTARMCTCPSLHRGSEWHWRCSCPGQGHQVMRQRASCSGRVSLRPSLT